MTDHTEYFRKTEFVHGRIVADPTGPFANEWRAVYDSFDEVEPSWPAIYSLADKEDTAKRYRETGTSVKTWEVTPPVLNNGGPFWSANAA